VIQVELETFLQVEAARVEGALQRALRELLPLVDDAVGGAIARGVTTGGKRLRPILCAEAYRACGGEGDIVDLAVSLELIHAYSLMHDDLPCMDNAPLRRGLPTPHIEFGVTATVLGGAVLIPGAVRQLRAGASRLGLSSDRTQALSEILCLAAGGQGMVGGQALDLDGEGRALGRQELDALHRGKTGALLRSALWMGGVAANASAVQVQALLHYGAAIGLAFQIADDVLDATSTEAALGKAPSDLAMDKSTYVRLLGVNGARAEARSLVAEAIRALENGGIDSSSLRLLAQFTVDRDH
jgi:geranylgeranyl pyrophosphate synthase